LQNVFNPADKNGGGAKAQKFSTTDNLMKSFFSLSIHSSSLCRVILAVLVVIVIAATVAAAIAAANSAMSGNNNNEVILSDATKKHFMVAATFGNATADAAAGLFLSSSSH
jgi:hypothetical protein